MVEFKAALTNEVEKLYKRKKVLVALTISLIFIIIGQLSMVVLRSGFGLRGVSSMDFPILVLSVVVNTILPLFTALVTIESFSGEFSQNTMKIALTRPISRLMFYSAKLTAIMLFILSNLLFVMIFSILAGCLFNANSFTLASLFKILLSYAVTLVPMVILSIIIAFFTMIIRSGIGVFFLSIFVFVTLKGLGILFYRYAGVFITSMMSWYTLFLMETIPTFKIFLQFMMMLSYAIIFFTAGYYLFDKKEF
ncbi:ABC transporter permease [Clostridium bowmanii]|uniref:ABC transporter permease n=1 Tax=Clostridium bowmanii TaxID=132925 RepID=UPI001C0BA9D4|nr:ABC transporter permease [Clostridium bowmanii]MBU3190129.1 ABC transporter permease [Clostridium bowmanii]MCA1074725.1 ABC transporter permease [Clostridium bowmanii]